MNGSVENRPQRNPTVTRQLTCDQKLKEPKNEKELKSFPVAIQYSSKKIETFSAQTDILRQLLKKATKWKWNT